MPTYQYECGACGHMFEELQSMTDPKLKKCPKCKKDKLHRLIGLGGGIIFKGTGFYQTDYKKNDAPSSSPASAPAGSCGSGCGCHPTASESTSESKSSTKKKKKAEA